jgi:hypothetical protein
MRFLISGLLAFLALPASAQLQFQVGGTAGFGASNNSTTSNNSSAWNNAPLGDAYFSSSLKVGSGLSLYSENLLALRRGRNGFSGFGAALKLETEAGYLGAGLGSYGWRGTGTRLFVGWPTGPHQTFELSYTRLTRGGSTEPVFTYGVRF